MPTLRFGIRVASRSRTNGPKERVAQSARWFPAGSWCRGEEELCVWLLGVVVERAQAPLLFSAPETLGEHAGGEIFTHFMRLPAADRPDAIFCLTGCHAAGVASAAVAHGVAVPGQLLVAGSLGAAQNLTSHPTVTAFDLQPEVLAQMAVDAVVRLVEGERLPQPVEVLPAILHARESRTPTGASSGVAAEDAGAR